MAGRIIEGKRQAEYIPGKTNEVVSVTEVKTLAVAFADSEGKRSVALVMAFGKDTEDGGLGVFTMANEGQMAEQLSIAPPMLKKGVRAWLQGLDPVSAEDVPAAVTQLAASAPVAVVSAGDLSGLDVGGGE